jgi:hypothetical protein
LTIISFGPVKYGIFSYYAQAVGKFFAIARMFSGSNAAHDSGQHRLFREYLLPRKPQGEYNPAHYFFQEPSKSSTSISGSLYEVLQTRVGRFISYCLHSHKYQRYDEHTSSIEQLLKALWHSEFQGRLQLYRTAIILLADVGLHFGMTYRSRRILEEIMPQVGALLFIRIACPIARRSSMATIWSNVRLLALLSLVA